MSRWPQSGLSGLSHVRRMGSWRSMGRGFSMDRFRARCCRRWAACSVDSPDESANCFLRFPLDFFAFLESRLEFKMVFFVIFRDCFPDITRLFFWLKNSRRLFLHFFRRKWLLFLHFSRQCVFTEFSFSGDYLWMDHSIVMVSVY